MPANDLMHRIEAISNVVEVTVQISGIVNIYKAGSSHPDKPNSVLTKFARKIVRYWIFSVSRLLSKLNSNKIDPALGDSLIYLNYNHAPDNNAIYKKICYLQQLRIPTKNVCIRNEANYFKVSEAESRNVLLSTVDPSSSS